MSGKTIIDVISKTDIMIASLILKNVNVMPHSCSSYNKMACQPKQEETEYAETKPASALATAGNLLRRLVGRAGVEPATNGLKGHSSTTELPTHE